ncbi:Protein GVQW1 [Plecturocebus cupreus]
MEHVNDVLLLDHLTHTADGTEGSTAASSISKHRAKMQWTTVRPSLPSYCSCHFSSLRTTLSRERLEGGVSRLSGEHNTDSWLAQRNPLSAASICFGEEGLSKQWRPCTYPGHVTDAEYSVDDVLIYVCGDELHLDGPTEFHSCCAGWSVVVRSKLSATSTSWVQMGFCHVGQAGLELLTSGDPPILASQSARITGVSYHIWPSTSFCYDWQDIMARKGSSRRDGGWVRWLTPVIPTP